ncbi:hypothetical protein ANCCAN_02569 [Ancylostoma caninum]|uniref:Uncharacterized protein n=1 Tax=Ancylostoma caninum TaxID=29170 RepID=A0A368H625_ANCCA|nr:hypothetical protein ANCCAN_02569 [Ancylostoma caninum]
MSVYAAAREEFLKEYLCEEHEENIREHCFVIKESNGEPFSPDACPEGYSLHVVTTKDEIKWALLLFGPKYNGAWIGNSAKSAGWLQPQQPYKPRKRGKHHHFSTKCFSLLPSSQNDTSCFARVVFFLLVI